MLQLYRKLPYEFGIILQPSKHSKDERNNFRIRSIL